VEYKFIAIGFAC